MAQETNAEIESTMQQKSSWKTADHNFLVSSAQENGWQDLVSVKLESSEKNSKNREGKLQVPKF